MASIADLSVFDTPRCVRSTEAGVVGRAGSDDGRGGAGCTASRTTTWFGTSVSMSKMVVAEKTNAIPTTMTATSPTSFRALYRCAWTAPPAVSMTALYQRNLPAAQLWFLRACRSCHKFHSCSVNHSTSSRKRRNDHIRTRKNDRNDAPSWAGHGWSRSPFVNRTSLIAMKIVMAWECGAKDRQSPKSLKVDYNTGRRGSWLLACEDTHATASDL
jgi:hypothetical protein